MAAIDSLLRLMNVRAADLLVIASGEVPVLRRGGQVSPLSMPALDRALVATFVSEVVDDDKRAQLKSAGSLDTIYELEDGAAFAVTVEDRAGAHRLTVRPRGTSTPKPARKVPLLPVKPTSPSPARARPRAAPAAPPATEPPVTEDRSLGAQAVAARVDASAADAASLQPLLERAVYEKASDLVLSSGHNPRIRVAGQLVELDGPEITDAMILGLVADTAGESDLRDLDRHGSLDLALEPRPGLRFRGNVFHQQHGLAAALRPIRFEVPSLRELNLPEHLYELNSFPHGMVLVCGPTGSGKSTTLVALIEHVNRNRARHIITLEDPIEYQYMNKRSLIHQRELGVHVDSFANGLRAALRESPDIIVVGEMRDLNTIAAALTAAETGHLVLGTMHAGDAAMAIDRVIDIFPQHQQRQVRVQLASVLRAVLTQHLLPSTQPPLRVPAFEKMIVTKAIAHQIRDNKAHQIASQILTGRDEGMVPLEHTLGELVRSSLITVDTACEVAPDQDVLRQRLRGY